MLPDFSHKISYIPLLLIGLLLSLLFFIYSYFWVDHGLVTFFSSNRPVIGNLFQLIKFTADNKILMAQIYFYFMVFLLIYQLIFLIPKIYNSIPLKPLLIVLGLITLIYSLSYPFLSRDIFSYYINAKIAYFYHLNPYTISPVELADRDFFVSVAHNIGASYDYGPVYLIYSIIPMAILTVQKIILYFLTLKLLNGLLFFVSGLLLFKMMDLDRRIFSIWFLNPYLLVEWLANSHNDAVMVTLYIMAYYFFIKKKLLLTIFFTISSILIKFASLVALPAFVLNPKWRTHYFKIIGLTLPTLIYLRGRAIEPWYLSWSYMFLPLAKLKTFSWIIFSVIGFISLINYHRFLESGGWGAGLIIPQPLLITNLLLLSIFIIEYFPFLKKIKLSKK